MSSFPAHTENWTDQGILASVAAAAIPDADGAAGQWIELIPAGVFFGRDGRGPFRLSNPDRVIAATGSLRMDAGLPVDYDHATDFAAPAGNPAPAAGWIRELEARSGAIWGRVEWTARASAAIAAREYRYVSPVFQFDPNDGAVTRLLRAGLTNNPNLYLTAIAAARTTAANAEDKTMDEFLTALRELLGMDGETSTDDVMDEIRKLRAQRGEAQSVSAHGADPAHFVGITEHQRVLSELHALRAERARDRAASNVEDAIRAGKLAPAQREWAIAYCAADPAGFAAFAGKQPAILAATAFPAERDPGHRAPALTAAEITICAQLGLKHSDYVQRPVSSRARSVSVPAEPYRNWPTLD
ncbi:MAG TPA: phage protease [Candidatus Binataceae bacterium]|nr:phage protease [Candidatus Binataceae bacterium]